MNRAFRIRWQRENLDTQLKSEILGQKLLELVEAPFVRLSGGLLLEPLSRETSGRAAFPDLTGFEAFVNKIHVEDLVDEQDPVVAVLKFVLQGVIAARVLARRLEEFGSYRVLLCVDPELPGATLRFFERRLGESWGPDDPDVLLDEEVMMIDTAS